MVFELFLQLWFKFVFGYSWYNFGNRIFFSNLIWLSFTKWLVWFSILSVLCPQLLTICRFCWQVVSHVKFQNQTDHNLSFPKLYLFYYLANGSLEENVQRKEQKSWNAMIIELVSVIIASFIFATLLFVGSVECAICS